MPDVVIAAIITSVISLVATTVTAAQTKKAAKRKGALEAERARILERSRKLDEMRIRAAANRAARANRAKLINTAAGQGVLFGSPVQGASQAITSNRDRELNFLQGQAALAAQADAVTQAQIRANVQATASSANASIVTAGITGLGTAAAAAVKAGVFSVDEPDEIPPEQLAF